MPMAAIIVDQPDLRRRYKAYCKELDRVDALRRRLMTKNALIKTEFFIDHGFWPGRTILPCLPVYPPECVGMICGAWGRSKGRPCQIKEIYRNGRCRFHGGLSTGPKTLEGKAIIADNLPKPKPHGGVDKS